MSILFFCRPRLKFPYIFVLLWKFWTKISEEDWTSKWCHSWFVNFSFKKVEQAKWPHIEAEYSVLGIKNKSKTKIQTFLHSQGEFVKRWEVFALNHWIQLHTFSRHFARKPTRSRYKAQMKNKEDIANKYKVYYEEEKTICWREKGNSSVSQF